MRRYEVVFVLAPSLTEEEYDQQVETYSDVAKEMGAEVIEVDKWGKNRLAYPIEKHKEGYYTVLTLEEAAGSAVAELERRFKVTDQVIRFLSVRVDLDLKRAAKLEQKREDRKARRRASQKDRVAEAAAADSKEESAGEEE